MKNKSNTNTTTPVNRSLSQRVRGWVQRFVSQEKLHWYCITFSGKNSDGMSCHACTYFGLKHDRGISRRFLNSQKTLAGVDDGAVLLSITKLGRMTKDQFSD